MKRIIIVGAGYSGLLTAKHLIKKFGKSKEIEITLIDRYPFHTLLTGLHEVAAGRVDEETIRVSLKKVFAGQDIKLVMDNVLSVDFDRKRVLGELDNYYYDYLVLAAGREPAFDNVPGAESYCHTLWSYEDAVKLHQSIHEHFCKAVIQPDEQEKKRLLTFYIVGAGVCGTELAGELAEYLPILCKKYEIEPALTSLCCVESTEQVLSGCNSKLAQKAQAQMEKMGIELLLNTQVCSIGKDYLEVRGAGGAKTKRDSSLVIWTAGTNCAQVTKRASRTVETNADGRIKLDAYLRVIGREDVFVAGDNMYYIPSGGQEAAPQAVENSIQSADLIAGNLTALLTGGAMKPYAPTFCTEFISVGSRFAVGRRLIKGKREKILSSFQAQRQKHKEVIRYLRQVLGWNKVIQYVKHEFFTIRDKRSYLGGHFSNRTPSFALLFLRLWAGFAWLFAGLSKLFGEWSSTPLLGGLMQDSKDWFNLMAGQGNGIWRARILWHIEVYLASAQSLSKLSLLDLRLRINFPVITWLVEKLVLFSSASQMTGQWVILVLQLIIGVCYILGLFCTPASIIAMLIQIVMLCTVGLPLGSLWMTFAALTLMFGSGRALGLDYYVSPLLKKAWAANPKVQRRYWYWD